MIADALFTTSSEITGPLVIITGKKNTALKKPRKRNCEFNIKAMINEETIIIGVENATNFTVSKRLIKNVVSSVKASRYHFSPTNLVTMPLVVKETEQMLIQNEYKNGNKDRNTKPISQGARNA